MMQDKFELNHGLLIGLNTIMFINMIDLNKVLEANLWNVLEKSQCLDYD